MSDEELQQLPDLNLAQARFILTLKDHPGAGEAKTKLLDAVTAESSFDSVTNELIHLDMYPLYLELCEQFAWPVDKDFVEKMQQANKDKIQALDAKIEDAEKNLGETEVREALLEKAEYYCLIGDKKEAENWLRVTYEKTVGIGGRIDIVLTLVRMGLFYNDNDLITRNIEKAKALIEQGGDWDRRNRLKVYEAYYLLSTRNFKKASTLFLDTMATFTATELISYEDFIFYSVLAGLLTLERVELKEKVVDSPEIKTIIHNIPHLQSYMQTFYDGDYAKFFVALAGITDRLETDRILSRHASFYCREMRVRAYRQLLKSYRSIELASLARSFGVSTAFIDRELSRFISLGRLNCKIDKVGGVVVTNRPDSKNAQYQLIIKQGDNLLNRISKLKGVLV